MRQSRSLITTFHSLLRQRPQKPPFLGRGTPRVRGMSLLQSRLNLFQKVHVSLCYTDPSTLPVSLRRLLTLPYLTLYSIYSGSCCFTSAKDSTALFCSRAMGGFLHRVAIRRTPLPKSRAGIHPTYQTPRDLDSLQGCHVSSPTRDWRVVIPNSCST